jgi:hypothetical protein
MNLQWLAPHLKRWLGGWDRFWFSPADPTVLGAVRIVVGAVTFFTLACYSPHLQELMGEDAWVDLELRREQVHDSPIASPGLEWGYFDDRYRPPQNDVERAYFESYQSKWGTPPPLPYPTSAREVAEIDAYMSRWGADPRLLRGKGQPVWSVWFHIYDPSWMAVAHGAIVVCSLMFFLGLATRFTSVLTWFGALSYIHRSPPSLFGVDTMMTVLLLYLMIGPSGAALSLDRLVARWWARKRGLPEPAVQPSVTANFALRLIQIHVCIIYLSAGLAKLQGQTWWTGVAPWGTLANYEYAPMNVPAYLGVLRWLARTRWLFEATMTIGAVGTLVFEIAYPFVIWRPSFRTTWLWLAALFHLGIGMFMGLRTFSLMMMAFNMAFLRPQTVHWAIQKMTPRAWRAPEAAPASVPVAAAETPRQEEAIRAAATGVRPEKLAPKPVVAVTPAKRKR